MTKPDVFTLSHPEICFTPLYQTTDLLWLKCRDGSATRLYWYQNDHLGAPQKLTAQDGAAVSRNPDGIYTFLEYGFS
jgi:hypothetical protein